MPRDELRQPLRRRSLSERLWARRPSALTATALTLLVLFVSGAVWVSRIPHPLAGEPVVIATIPPVEELKTSSTTVPETAAEDPPPDPAMAEAEDVPAAGPEPEASPKAYQNEASIVMAAHRPLKPAPIAAVTEDSPDGPLPRISAGGKKPADAYAQVTPLAVVTSARPKIAILLGGMGLNARLTKKAMDALPGDVTFGFAPYGDKLQETVNAARARGHEIMLQLPMEPVGFPATNPGPRTLLADSDADTNVASLRWLMSRFAGFTGATNYMGGRFLAAPESVAPVMAELKKRGLVYLEDATVPVSTTPAVAKSAGLPMRRAAVVIDATPDAASIAEALAQLEKEAETNGYAIGTGSGLEVTIDTLSEWASELSQKGILLVPVSAVYKGRMS